MKSAEESVFWCARLSLVSANGPALHVESRQRLDNAETERSASNAAARKAEGRSIRLIERAIKLLETGALGLRSAIVVPIAHICVFVSSFALRFLPFVLPPGLSFQSVGEFQPQAANRDGLLGQRLFHRKWAHRTLPSLVLQIACRHQRSVRLRFFALTQFERFNSDAHHISAAVFR